MSRVLFWTFKVLGGLILGCAGVASFVWILRGCLWLICFLMGVKS